MSNGATRRTPVRLSVIVPVFDEGAHLGESLGRIQEALCGIEGEHELVVVDDGSADRSWDEIRAFSRTASVCVVGLKLSRNFGKESALWAGLDQARGEAVVVMDADQQHPPSLLAEMVALWQAGGVDIVDAVKLSRGQEHPIRSFLAERFYALFRHLSGLDLSGASDFKLLSRQAVESMQMFRERGLFFRGLSAWLGFSRKTIAFEVPARVQGRSQWSLGKLAALAATAFISFSQVPLFLLFGLAVLFFVFAVLLGLFAVYRWAVGTALGGFTTVIILNLIMGSCIMAGISIIGLYVGQIYDEVRMRPRYLLAERFTVEGGTAAEKRGGE